MKRSFLQDYKFGIQKQSEVLKIIKKYFKDESIIEYKDNFSKHDFVGSGKTFELKSRTNHYNTYPDTLLPRDKILKGCRNKQIFLFNFTDKLTYIEYDEKLFEKFKCNPFRRIQRKDILDKEKLYYYIPINELKIICEYNKKDECN